MISEDHVGFYLEHLLAALFKCIFCVCVCVRVPCGWMGACVLLNAHASMCTRITRQDNVLAAVMPQLCRSQCDLFTSLPVKCEGSHGPTFTPTHKCAVHE